MSGGGHLREANWVFTASAVRTPTIGANASGTLRGILHGSKRASPNTWGDVKLDMKLPPKAVRDTLSVARGGRDRASTGGGGI
jgi:hypothetical protein